MKNIVLIVLMCLIVSLVALPVHAQMSFGGELIPQAICNGGTLFLVPPYGIFFFSSLGQGIPLGDQVLGIAGIAMVPCILGIVPQGAGFPVLLYGDNFGF